MATRLSNKDLKEKCRRFLLADPASEALDGVLEDALAQAELEIRRLGKTAPLAWLRGEYSNLFTRVYGTVQSVTQADPGVFDIDSLDSDITGHGLSEDDILYAMGFADDSMDELNNRMFRVKYINSTTVSLETIDAFDEIDTSGLDAYDSGGYAYHCGIKLPTTSIEPGSTVDASYRWMIGNVYGVCFDSLPADPIDEFSVISNPETWLASPGTPVRWRYWRNDLATFDSASAEHFVLFYPPCGSKHNIQVFYEKEYPTLSVWDANTYPPHIPEVHDAIWHRALSNMVGNAERQRRESKDGRLMGQIEVAFAQRWIAQALRDEQMVLSLSRSMTGTKASHRGMSA